MKRTGLLLWFLSFAAWTLAQVVAIDMVKNDTLNGMLKNDSVNDSVNGTLKADSLKNDSLKADSLKRDSLEAAKTHSVEDPDSLLGDLFDLMNDEDLQPMDAPQGTAGSTADSTAADSAADSAKTVTLDSLDIHTLPLIGMDVVMPDPTAADSLLMDSVTADSTLLTQPDDSLYNNKVVKDSTIMEQILLDSTVIDTLKFDSAYYYKQEQMVRDSLRRDSIRLAKQAAEKRRLMIPLAIREFKEMVATHRREFDALLDEWDDYYNLHENVKMRPEFYKFVVPTTYYSSSIHEAGNIDGWEPTDKYTDQQKQFEQHLNEQLPDLRSSQPYYDAVERQMLHFYVNYPQLVSRNEEEFANISLLSDKDMEAAPRSEKVLNMIGPYNTVEPVTESDLTVYRPNFWTKGGSGYLHFSQNHISDNWYKGGESTKSLLSGLVLFANFNDKHRIQFENKLEWKLGFITAPSDTLHSYKANNDLFRLTSKFGLKAVNRWYYTLSVDFRTQFFSSYQTNTDNLVSAFFSPAELNIGLGMDYKYVKDGICNLSVLLNPVNYTLHTVVSDRVDPTKFNIKEGHKHESVIGSRFEANLKWKVFRPLMWESRLSYTTNYEKALADWENTFTFAVNKYISTKLFVNLRFDDGVARKEGDSYFQVQEILSFGLNYTW